jgi:tetratricopeptide (TPR) repeat protein
MTGSPAGPEACGRQPGPPRSVVWSLAAAIVALLAASLWLFVRRPPQARTSAGLDVRQVGRLVAAGQFEQALQRVESAAAADPDNGVLRVMAAQLALDRPDAQPQRALEHLDRFRSADPVLAARAAFARGRAVYALYRFVEAEGCWLEALKLDPQIPEAAWALLDLYYLEGRPDDARRLALRQHDIEPDPHDRVHLLLELVRQDAEPPEPGTLAARFAPVVRAHPDDLHAVLTLGRALARNSQADEGLALLDDATRRWPDSREAWDALLTSLDAVGRPERLAEAWGRVAPRWRDDDALARHEGEAAMARGDRAIAARAYRRAWDARPDDVTSAYRLARLLHALGRHDQAADCDRFVRGAQAARAELPDLYKQADAARDLGLRPHGALYRRLADNRERLGLRDEARAWHRLVLRERPDDPYSRSALERLQSPAACAATGGRSDTHRDPGAQAGPGRPRGPEP